MNNRTMKTKILSTVMSLVLLLSLVPSVIFAEALQGDGSQENPYRIATAADLEAFRDLVNSTDACGAYAELEEDIQLSGDWTPIGTQTTVSKQYKGVFDGKNHEISGVNINKAATNQGLFGAINGAVIQNVRVSGTINCGTSNYIGGIVGKMQAGTIQNCSFSGSVTGGYTGGIVGNFNAASCTISNCANTASVTGTYAGGILGYSTKKETIENCYNTGAVKGSSRSSGIAGQLSSGKITNCYSIGEITGNGNIGGIYCFSSAAITNCYYTSPETQNKGYGSASGEEKIDSPDGLKDKLGNAFIEDENNINNGYPILAWQTGGVVEKDPRIEISGDAALEMVNSGAQPSTVLSVTYKDMDDTPAVEWTVREGAELVTAEAPTDPDANNSQLVVTAKHAGTVVIVATAGEYSAEFTISVIPCITTISYNDNLLHGEEFVPGDTVFANVNTTDGEYDYEHYAKLKYQWRSCKDTIHYENIPGATDRTYTIGADYADSWIDCVVSTPKKDYSNYYLTVLSEEYANLIYDRKQLSLDESAIKENTTLTLPAKGEKGTDITWTSSNPAVINPETGAVILPESGIAEVELKATLTYKNESRVRTFTISVYSQAAVEEERNNKQKKLEDAVNALGGGYYKLYPVYGTNQNVLDMVKADLQEKSTEKIGVTLKTVNEIYGGAAIAENGDITYYYRNPNETAVTNFAQYQVVFEFTLDDAVYDLNVPVMLYWDRAKVQSAMKQEILDQVTLNETEITENLELPKVVDNKKWTQISWNSSNTNALSISSENQQTADTLFNPYVGVVRRGMQDEKVTLTATFTFMLTNDVTGNEEPITMTKVFNVTVKAMDREAAEKIQKELADKLDQGFAATGGLRDAATGELLTEQDGAYVASYDIKLPTTKDFGVDGKYYPVSITSSDEDVLVSPDVNNAARVQVIRPAVGKQSATAELTVSISDKNANVSASKSFDIIVTALTEEEITTEKELMEKVLASYFDGIKGSNATANNISHDLSPFTEVYEKGGALVWARSNKEMTGHGIVPTALNGWEELEAWRLFKSTNPAAITHENLLVTLQNNAKAVTISSALSSETLGIYGKLYQQDPVKYADYKELSDLYYREVSADVIVRGLSSKGNSLTPVTETVNVTFSLQGSDGTWIASTKYENQPETATAFDVFKQALKENGYTYKAKGSYVQSITTPDGDTLAEFDEGQYSGWMYRVNGKLPNMAMSGYGLKDGDTIKVFYSKNGLEESGYSDDTKKDNNKNNSSNGNGGTVAAPTQPTQPDSSAPAFGDIQNHWAKSNIEAVNRRGLMKGVSENEFAPDQSLTRGMFVTILYRIEDEPSVSGLNFTDVQEDAWYAKAVAWANENGIVLGISDHEFAPNSVITREQMAVILYRYAQFKQEDVSVGENTNILSYTDVESASKYAISALQWAVGSGILAGKSAQTLNPADTATRAETAAVIVRLLDR